MSLQHQSVRPHEVVISDDGSEDSQLPVLEQLAPTLDFKLVFARQDDQGFRLARCRNNGIMAASGDYIIFMDQDLLFTRDYVKTHRDNAAPGQFLVSQVVRLSEEQSRQITDTMIMDSDYSAILTPEQLKENRAQFRRDGFYYYSRNVGYRTHRPKLKGGLASILKEDILRVNGYDEQFVGWGNEDDDLGRRLYAAGIRGRNPFRNDFALHFYHEPYHDNGERVNEKYYRKRVAQLSAHNYRCDHGIDDREADTFYQKRIN